MEVLIVMIALIFAVLNLILFFKIWGMTNNIKLIKKHFEQDELPIDVLVRLLKMEGVSGEELQKVIASKMAKNMIAAYNDYNISVADLNKRWQRHFECAGVDMPEYLKAIDDRDKIAKLYDMSLLSNNDKGE